MIDIGIAILGWNRPMYLDINLQSLTLVRGVNEVPVYVSVDGGGKADAYYAVVRRWDDSLAIEFRALHRRLHIMWHHMDAIHYVLDRHEICLYVTEDVIWKTDALEYAEKSDFYTHTFVGMIPSRAPRMRSGYCTIGCLINRARFAELEKWVRTRQYYGMPTFTNLKMGESIYSSDSVFDTFLWRTGGKCAFPDEGYICHIGFEGINTNAEKVEQALFDQPREKRFEWVLQWLKDNPDQQMRYDKGIRPPTFVYE